MGEVRIAPRHAPLLTRLQPGTLLVHTPDRQLLPFFLGGGIPHVHPLLVTVLAYTALPAQDIDVHAAQAPKSAYTTRLAGSSRSYLNHSGEAQMVFAPAERGEVGIAPRHAPLLTRLKPGTLRVQTPDGQMLPFFVGGGILEVQPHLVTVLADTALRAKDIDEAAAQAAKDECEQRLAGAR